MLQISHTCCKHQFQPNACSSCFKQYFPFLLGGENIHNFFIKSIASSHYLLNPLSVLAALKILRDILSFTRSFIINTRPLVACLENSDRKVKQFRVTPRITADCFKSFCLQFVDTMSYECVWFCNVTSERLGSNGFFIFSDKFGLQLWGKPNTIRMQSSISVILPTWAVFSLSLSLPPQILRKSTYLSDWTNGKRDVLKLKQPEVNTDLLHFSALSYYKSSVETNFPIFAIAFSH